MDENARILVAGETLIDFLPDSPGPLSGVEEFARRPGGAPANVAVGIARLDAPPLFWTRIGSDPFGDFLAETLADDGIPDRFVTRDEDAKTTLAFVSHDADADRAFTFYRDGTADTTMTPGTVPDEVLSTIEWVHVGGVSLASVPSRTAILELIERARERDCLVSFDPNARPELWPERGAFEAAVETVLEDVDVVKATPEDLSAAGFSAEGPEALAEAVSERGPNTVFLTLGEEGSYASATDDAPWAGTASHPGYDVEVVDTTGAGDAFTAGAITALAEGEDLETALAFANAVAALATTETGAMTALPDRDAVDELLEGW